MSRYATGHVIDEQYEVLEHLGSGRFAEVYRVRNRADDLKYALKLYHQGDVEDVARELRPLRHLDHPNVVNAHWGGRLSDGSWFVALDVVTGESLRARLDEFSRLDVDEIRDIGSQLLEALAAIHPNEDRLAELQALDERSTEEHDEWRELEETGVVHRDVKPENIVVSDDGLLVLCGFGIASRAGTRRETVSYTPHYSPPGAWEIPSGEWKPDVDRFAAGVVLFEGLCGSYPDQTDDIRGVLERSGSAPRDLISFLEIACARSEEDRFATTSSMIELWGDIHWEDGAGRTPPVVRNVPNALDLSDEEVRALLLDLVRAHGPIICSDLYRLFAAATKSNPTRRLNRLIYAMLTNPRIPLQQREPLGGGQRNKTVFIADS